MKIVRTLILGACVLAAPSIGAAQQTVDNASVSGRVIDPSGAVVAGASVNARQIETNVVTTTTTDTEGRFRFPYLKVGPYEIAVQIAGFQPATRRLVLGAGAAFELPIALSLDAVDTSVTVSADATPLEAARSQIASTVSQAEVANLPMNGRNFLEVALLAPGVAPTNIASTQMFPETSAVPGISLSVNSQRNLSNSFIVDGLSANDDAAGLSGITYSVEAIDQFQVVTSGGQAELGRALGGYVNIVTKSGTNAVRGSAYQFFRDDALNARNALSGTTLPMRQSQFGGSIGGPIAKDRTFYFANVEHRALDQTGLATISRSVSLAVNARLDAVGYGGPHVATGDFPSPVDTTNAFAKVDHRPRRAVATRLALQLLRRLRAELTRRGRTVCAKRFVEPRESRFVDGGESSALPVAAHCAGNTRAVRVQPSRSAAKRHRRPGREHLGRGVVRNELDQSYCAHNTMWQVVNNLSHQAGAHAIRIGVDFLYNDDVITFPRSYRGSYTFSSLANFLAGTYNNAGFTQTFGESRVAQGNPNRRGSTCRTSGRSAHTSP